MNLDKLEIPKIESVKSTMDSYGIPELTDLSYDLWTLRITLNFESNDSPVYVLFKEVIGFRLLDEVNLNEYWIDSDRPNGWLWEIKEGGWFDLEKLRKGFVEAYHENERRKEYLIVGIHDCLNVMTTCEPVVNHE